MKTGVERAMPTDASVDSSTDRKNRFIASFLVINALAWFFMTITMLDNLLISLEVTETQTIIIWTVYYLTLTGLGIIGAILTNKVNRIKFLGLWIIFGALITSFPLLFANPTMNQMPILAILLGGSLGIGMPSCLAYFADNTFIENRGRTSGMIFLFTNLAAITLFSIGITNLNIVLSWVILSIWRASGLIVFFLKPKEKIVSKTKTKDSFKVIFNNKSFLLYFVAWFMFMLVDRSEAPMVRFFLNDPTYLMIAPIIGSFSAFVGCLLADRVGRKRIVIIGFVTYGIAYAAVGIAPDFPFSKLFFLSIESVSTGILVATFILLLWGDLSEFGSREKYYAIGISPFFLTSIFQLFSGKYLMEIPNTSAFSLAAFFLFLAVLPLLYAPETLPEKKMELRRLRKFAEEAKKAKEKYERKNKD
jgi:MFS family permease